MLPCHLSCTNQRQMPATKRLLTSHTARANKRLHSFATSSQVVPSLFINKELLFWKMRRNQTRARTRLRNQLEYQSNMSNFSYFCVKMLPICDHFMYFSIKVTRGDYLQSTMVDCLTPRRLFGDKCARESFPNSSRRRNLPLGYLQLPCPSPAFH